MHKIFDKSVYKHKVFLIYAIPIFVRLVRALLWCRNCFFCSFLSDLLNFCISAMPFHRIILTIMTLMEYLSASLQYSSTSANHEQFNESLCTEDDEVAKVPSLKYKVFSPLIFSILSSPLALQILQHHLLLSMSDKFIQ